MTAPKPTPIDVQRFEPSDGEGAREFLAERGFVVFKSVLDGEGVKHAEGLLWDFLKEEEQVVRGDPSTWSGWSVSPSNGIVSRNGVGQSDFLWYLRTQPGVVEAFEEVWGGKEAVEEQGGLLTSFDGCCMFRPTIEHPEWETRGGWYHVDQGPSKAHMQCYQGIVSLTEGNEHTGGLVVMDGSHKKFDSIMQGYLQTGGSKYHDYCPLKHETAPHLHAWCRPVIPRIYPGDMVVWNSKTQHCSTPPTEPAPHPRDEMLRVVGYISMVPASCVVDDGDWLERYQAYLYQQGTTHWCFDIVTTRKKQEPRKDIASTPPLIQQLVAGRHWDRVKGMEDAELEKKEVLEAMREINDDPALDSEIAESLA